MERKNDMKENTKTAIFVGAMAGSVIAGGAILLKKRIEKEKKIRLRENGHVEFTMSAGDMEEDSDEDWLIREEQLRKQRIQELSAQQKQTEEEAKRFHAVETVLPSGPKTLRVRPTEEEEKENLRRKLEKVIRF